MDHLAQEKLLLQGSWHSVKEIYPYKNRALACNVDARFLKVVASGIVDKYIGESARVIREMFGTFLLCGFQNPNFDLCS